MVSEIEVFHCTVHSTLYRGPAHHVLTRVAKCIDVDGGIFETVSCVLGKLYLTLSLEQCDRMINESGAAGGKSRHPTM
jgi:hypothetical protein